MGCVCKGDASASLTGMNKGWGEGTVGRDVSENLLQPLLSFPGNISSTPAPLLSNLIRARETGFAAVSDHSDTHQQSKHQICFVRMAKSYPSPFQCRDKISGA